MATSVSAVSLDSFSLTYSLPSSLPLHSLYHPNKFALKGLFDHNLFENLVLKQFFFQTYFLGLVNGQNLMMHFLFVVAFFFSFYYLFFKKKL